MNKNEYLGTVRKQIHFIFDRDSIEKELREHLEDSMMDLMEDGLSEQEAEVKAVTQMGNPVEVGKQLNKEHHPVLGYAWMASKFILILLMIPTLLVTILGGYNALQLITPIVIDESKETFPVNIELDLPTHHVKIDNICLSEEGYYRLTYRSWIKHDYSRAGWTSQLFHLQDSNEEYLIGGGYNSSAFIGSYGYQDFSYPEDSLLYIVGRDGTKIELNLKEYCDEKK